MFKQFIQICCCAALLVSYSAKAEVTEQDITRIERALNSITTFKASFTQTTEDGQISHGTFYLSRPGKIRWEYIKPPVIIVGQKALIAYYDGELDEVSYMRLEDVLASFLTREAIDLHKDLKIVSLDKNNGLLQIKVVPSNPDTPGQLTLSFEDNSLILKGLEVLDNIGKKTNISFEGIEQGMVIQPSLFLYPKEKRKGRKTH
jgi:outer membrane lipoprotein carrier protein